MLLFAYVKLKNSSFRGINIKEEIKWVASVTKWDPFLSNVAIRPIYGMGRIATLDKSIRHERIRHGEGL